MAKGHRSQIKRERNAVKDTRHQQNFHMLEYQFRRHASYWMLSEEKTLSLHSVS